MGDRIKNTARLEGLSIVDANLEKLDALGDLVKLYSKQIKLYLNIITTDKVLQAQILNELQIKLP